jgi:hypothetical protein
MTGGAAKPASSGANGVDSSAAPLCSTVVVEEANVAATGTIVFFFFFFFFPFHFSPLRFPPHATVILWVAEASNDRHDTPDADVAMDGQKKFVSAVHFFFWCFFFFFFPGFRGIHSYFAALLLSVRADAKSAATSGKDKEMKTVDEEMKEGDKKECKAAAKKPGGESKDTGSGCGMFSCGLSQTNMYLIFLFRQTSVTLPCCEQCARTLSVRVFRSFICFCSLFHVSRSLHLVRVCSLHHDTRFTAFQTSAAPVLQAGRCGGTSVLR